ncbi:MAG: hypothetical protein QW328_07760 [Nitrososphaerota archaeon]
MGDEDEAPPEIPTSGIEYGIDLSMQDEHALGVPVLIEFGIVRDIPGETVISQGENGLVRIDDDGSHLGRGIFGPGGDHAG